MLESIEIQNQRGLAEDLAQVRRALEHCIRAGSGAPGEEPAGEVDFESTDRSPALANLATRFQLSFFEKATLLLTAGIELESEFADLCGASHGARFPSFGLALAIFPGAHWSALAPDRALRYWRLIEVEENGPLVGARLRIDEFVLHYLAGVPAFDRKLEGLLDQYVGEPELAPSQSALVDRMVEAWQRNPESTLFFCGPDHHRSMAAATGTRLGLRLFSTSTQVLPREPAGLENFARLWMRFASLIPAGLYIDCPEPHPLLERLLDRLSGFIALGGEERFSVGERSLLVCEWPALAIAERLHLWQRVLGVPDADPALRAVARQFPLAVHQIRSAVARAGDGDLWEAARETARQRLEDLAERLTPGVRFEDLVLPDEQREILRNIAVHVRRQEQVYEEWGFGAADRGLGVVALFAGVSGTGKTMAAEAIAADLHLDIYRIDLSLVVSKYIGETEKHLRRLFAAAERGGAILLFDEADALFGKRSEVKDSHDRYANIGVSYLLQRMESYRGLSILTTNKKDALDQAFLRRLRFIVYFQFPGPVERELIWRRIWPARTPHQGLDFAKLARLNIAGGHIRSIALDAAFRAADAGRAVTMQDLLAAARAEYRKQERRLTEEEIAGWLDNDAGGHEGQGPIQQVRV